MKYKLTDETIEFAGRTLYRIQALKDFSDVKEGDLGGFVESEENLSQDGNCWIYDDKEVFGNFRVFGEKKISRAKIYSDAKVYGCKVYGVEQIEKFVRSLKNKHNS